MGDVAVFDNSLGGNVCVGRIVAVKQRWTCLLRLRYNVVTAPNLDFDSAVLVTVPGDLICIHIQVLVWKCQYVELQFVVSGLWQITHLELRKCASALCPTSIDLLNLATENVTALETL